MLLQKKEDVKTKTIKMKNIVLLLFVVVCGCGESKESIKEINGEIYIKLIDVKSSMYGMPEEKIQHVRQRILSNKNHDSLSESELDVREYYKKILKHGLLDKPYFKMKTDENSIVNVFTDEAEYTKLKPILEKLDGDKEKILISFKGVYKEKDILYTSNIISVEKVIGSSDWSK